MSDKPKRSHLVVVSNTSEPPPITAFFYGHSKSGKTTLAASACEVEEMSPVVMIDCGTSSASVQGEPRFASLDVLRAVDFDGVSEAHTWLSPKGGNALETKGYKTIILDELDQLWFKAMTKVMQRNVTTGDHHNKSRADINDVWLEDFGETRSMVLNVISGFLKLNTNLIVCSLVRIKEDAVDTFEYRMPSLAGQLRDDVPSQFAVYGYLDVQIPSRGDSDPFGKRIAYFTSTRKFKAGIWGPSRADRFGAEMVNPTMQEIYDNFVGTQ
jgi:hypothetical protein